MNKDFAEDIVKKALKKGCDAVEVFIKSSRGISVEAKEGKVEALEASQEIGIAVKVINKQKLGFAFTTDPEAVDIAVDEAVEASKWNAADEYIDIPERMPAAEVLIFDEQIKNVKEDEIIRNALMLEESALSFDKRVRRVRKAEVGTRVANTVIANSKGIGISYESTDYSAHVTVLAGDASGDNQMGWNFAGSRRMSDIDVNSIGSVASKRAVELLGSRKISAVKAPVILSPSVAVGFLDILSASLSAEAVQKQRSFLAGKLGQALMNAQINIIDEGKMSWGNGTRPVDDEGVPVTDKTVISNGILKSYLYNTYAAKKDGVRSTGNAVRSSHKALPGIDVTNFYIKPSESRKPEAGSQKSNEENRLIKSLSRGILIQSAMGLHTANPISGDFSVGISGQWIENGEILYPVKEAIISGNILELFKRLEGLGEDLEFYGNLGSPSLLIAAMDISA